MDKRISGIAVFISGIALSVCVACAAYSYRSNSQIDLKVEQALERREQSVVDHYLPHVRKLCSDFGVAPPDDPESIEALVEPLVQIVTSTKNQ